MPTRPPPAPKNTIEVDASWLEVLGPKEPKAPKEEGLPRKPKGPPPIPGAKRRAPPMPVAASRSVRPPRRETMEVRAEWLEEAPDSKKSAARASKAPPAGKSVRPKRPIIPRED